jgi:chemotaxis signal transduction protein
MAREGIDKGQVEFGNSGPGTAGRKLQLVHAGGSQFGIFVDEISAIVSWQEPAPLPHAPGSVLGVVSIQGRMLTVLDLAALPLGEAVLATLVNDSREALEYLIALNGDEQLALAIEAAGEVVQLPNDSTASPLIDQEATTTPVLGFLQRGDAQIKILNPKGLFPAAIQGRERRQRRF